MKCFALTLILIFLFLACTRGEPGMTLIPEGEFTLGIHPDGDITQFISDMTLLTNAQPAQRIFLKAYYIDLYEITYEAFLKYKHKLK